MCGRYRLSRRQQLIEEYFASVSRGEEDWNPRYNIAPTQPVPVIRQNPKELRAGIVPDALGIDTLMRKGFGRRGQHDQRKG
jgi:putative SOS response-associated peptidase YedK